MATKSKNSKKQRASKTSKGVHGSGGKLNRSFSEVEKVLLNQGMMVGVNKRWRPSN